MRALAAAALALLLMACAERGAEPVAVEDPWIREAPPGARALAGYMDIVNHHNEPVALLHANSPEFERVELHVTRHDGDRMRMEQVDHIALPPRETVQLVPGGLHLMLIGPERPFAAGDRVRIELSFSDGTVRDVVFPVRDVRGHDQ
jgi:copper(I)-binding protein